MIALEVATVLSTPARHGWFASASRAPSPYPRPGGQNIVATTCRFDSVLLRSSCRASRIHPRHGGLECHNDDRPGSPLQAWR